MYTGTGDLTALSIIVEISDQMGTSETILIGVYDDMSSLLQDQAAADRKYGDRRHAFVALNLRVNKGTVLPSRPEEARALRHKEPLIQFEAGTEKMVENGDDQGQAILSIAASLKRIADAVDPPDASINGTFLERAENVFNNCLGQWLRSR